MAQAEQGGRPEASPSSPPAPPTGTTVFNWGSHRVDTCVVQKSGFLFLSCFGFFKSILSCFGIDFNCLIPNNCYEEREKKYPPKEILIVHPIESGTYPVLLFFPGTSLVNSFYSQLFKHISSHGFIVVSPQVK